MKPSKDFIHRYTPNESEYSIPEFELVNILGLIIYSDGCNSDFRSFAVLCYAHLAVERIISMLSALS